MELVFPTIINLTETPVNQYKINRMFMQNQERVYQQIDGKININNEKPNAEESK